MYDEDDRYDLEGRPLGKWIGITVVLGVIGAFGFTLLRGQQDQTSRAEALVIAATQPTTPAPAGNAAPASTTTAPTTTAPTPDSNEPAPTTTTSTTVALVAPATPAAPTVPGVTPVAEPASPATAGSAPSTTVSPPASDMGYPAAPDGSPLPVVVTYDTGEVTLTGAVPGEDAQERLVALAQANSQEPDIEVVDNLFVNAAVPASVGVRVIEMNSPRFGEGEAQLLPEHTVQFDRVAAVLEALPHVTVLVIGHADQRGDDQVNRELSEGRASTVVDYLAYRGINPTRLSMRGAGETDLLTLDDDASALALNRRTEFVFYGVLV